MNHNPEFDLAPGNAGREDQLLLRRSAGGAGVVAEINVSRASIRRLKAQIGKVRAFPSYDLEPERYEMACEALVARYAPDVARQVRRVRDMVDQIPALLIVRGLQVDDTPVPTPIDGVFRQDQAAVEAAILIGVMRNYGLSGVAFATENDGKLFRAVCPVEARSKTASSQGAEADLRAHSDNNHFVISASNDVHPYRFPMVNAYQFFSAIVPVDEVPMRIKINDDVILRLDPGGGPATKLPQYEDLQRAEYRFSSPPSHGVMYKIEPLPVLVALDDIRLGLAMRFHAATMEGVTPRARAALDLLRHAWDRTPEEVIRVRRGDIIAYDNRRVTHRREPYKASFDGTDRYYVRVYGQPIEQVARWASVIGGNGRVM